MLKKKYKLLPESIKHILNKKESSKTVEIVKPSVGHIYGIYKKPESLFIFVKQKKDQHRHGFYSSYIMSIDTITFFFRKIYI